MKQIIHYVYDEKEMRAIKNIVTQTKEDLIAEISNNNNALKEDTVQDIIHALNKINLPNLTNYTDYSHCPYSYEWYYDEMSPFPNIEISIGILQAESFHSNDLEELNVTKYTIRYSIPLLTIPIYETFNSHDNQKWIKEILEEQDTFKDISERLRNRKGDNIK